MSNYIFFRIKMTDTQQIFEHLKFMSERMPSNFYWVDLDGKILGLNQKTANSIGVVSIESVIGKTVYDIYPYDIADSLWVHIQEVITTLNDVKKEHKIKDLSTQKDRFYSDIMSPILDYNGEIIGVCGTSIEITAEKEAERLRYENDRHLANLKVQEAITKEQESFRKAIGQMVHDIQSPISSLNSLVNEATLNLPEDKRNLLRTAVNGITDITNHMFSKYSNPSAEAEHKQPVFVSSALLQIASEKRHEYKDRSIKFVTNFAKDTEFSFIKIEPVAFNRMISNLINNAVDAIGDKADGEIELRLHTDSNLVTICVEDNGKGMPDELIERIKSKEEFTEGKEDGHGLGLMQVHDTIERNNAILKVISIPDEGTTMNVKFPKIPMPIWIADQIKITADDLIIVIDDDESIHFAWKNRFKAIQDKAPELQLIHFTDGSKALKFINQLSTEEKERIYLLADYELIGQGINGIDIIQQSQVKRALLVTSHYATPKIRDLALANRVKLLPKNLAFAVKIKLDKKLIPGSRIVDMVWIDDEKQMIEKIVQDEYSHLKVDIYADPIGFLDEVHQYPSDTKIILDQYFFGYDINCELDGLHIAELLNKQGYTKLFLITAAMPPKVPEYLKVILKSDIEKVHSLDKL